MKPPTKRTVVLETIVALAASAPALAAVTVLQREVPKPAVTFLGVLVATLLFPAIYSAVFGRVPDLFASRPWKYSLPNAVGMVAATAAYASQDFDSAATFAVVVSSLVAGGSVSQLWFSLAGDRQAVASGA